MSGVASRLEQFRDGRYYLTASCSVDHSCAHYGRLDMGLLIEKLGAGFNIIEGRTTLLSKLRCSRCGRRGAEIRLGVRDTGSSDIEPTLRTVW